MVNDISGTLEKNVWYVTHASESADYDCVQNVDVRSMTEKEARQKSQLSEQIKAAEENHKKEHPTLGIDEFSKLYLTGRVDEIVHGHQAAEEAYKQNVQPLRDQYDAIGGKVIRFSHDELPFKLYKVGTILKAVPEDCMF